MAKKASLGKEIALTIPNKIGMLAEISKILADAGVNIDTVVGYTMDNAPEAVIMFVTSDNAKAIKALGKGGYKDIKENEVVIVELENTVGAMESMSSKLAPLDIDIKYIYGTTCTGSCAARLVLSTSDNVKAVEIFNK